MPIDFRFSLWRKKRVPDGTQRPYREYVACFRMGARLRFERPKLLIRGLFVAAVLALVLYFPVLERLNDRWAFPGLRNGLLHRTDYDRMRTSVSSGYRSAALIRETTPHDALFLVFRMGDFLYYGDRKMIRDADPRMGDVYRASSKEEAWRRLLDLDIDYVFLPGYFLPTITQTVLQDVLTDPELTRLVYTNGSQRLLRLNKKAEAVRFEPLPLPNPDFRELNDEGRPVGWELDGTGGAVWEVDGKGGVFHVDNRGSSTISIELAAQVPALPRCPGCSPTSGEHYFTAKVSGSGYATLDIALKSGYKNPVRHHSIWNGLLAENGRRIGGVFRIVSSNEEPIRILFRLYGRSRMSLSELRLSRVVYPSPLGQRESLAARW